MEVDLVRTSRTGDALHYRWAARRCLRMIDPKSPVKAITIEGSRWSEADGEYVIDLAEYGERSVRSQDVAYYQLKHSILRLGKYLDFTEASKTLAGFADRYREARKRRVHQMSSFTLVTNRKISPQLKTGIERIRLGKKATPKLQANLEKWTKLSGSKLRSFCQVLILISISHHTKAKFSGGWHQKKR